MPGVTHAAFAVSSWSPLSLRPHPEREHVSVGAFA